MKRAAVFFDRDNTLIANDGYLGDPGGVVLVDGAADAVARVRGMGFAAITFSNQSGVARGKFTEEAVHAVNARLDELLQEEDDAAVIGRHEFCPFHPDATIEKYRIDSDLRKPKPGMIFQAAKRLDLDLSRSWVIGDAPRDIEAGKAAGCRTILFVDPKLPASPASEGPSTVTPDYLVTSLKAAVDIIVNEVLGPIEVVIPPPPPPPPPPPVEPVVEPAPETAAEQAEIMQPEAMEVEQAPAPQVASAPEAATTPTEVAAKSNGRKPARSASKMTFAERVKAGTFVSAGKKTNGQAETPTAAGAVSQQSTASARAKTTPAPVKAGRVRKPTFAERVKAGTFVPAGKETSAPAVETMIDARPIIAYSPIETETESPVVARAPSAETIIESQPAPQTVETEPESSPVSVVESRAEPTPQPIVAEELKTDVPIAVASPVVETGSLFPVESLVPSAESMTEGATPEARPVVESTTDAPVADAKVEALALVETKTDAPVADVPIAETSQETPPVAETKTDVPVAEAPAAVAVQEAPPVVETPQEAPVIVLAPAVEASVEPPPGGLSSPVETKTESADLSNSLSHEDQKIQDTDPSTVPGDVSPSEPPVAEPAVATAVVEPIPESPAVTAAAPVQTQAESPAVEPAPLTETKMKTTPSTEDKPAATPSAAAKKMTFAERVKSGTFQAERAAAAATGDRPKRVMPMPGDKPQTQVNRVVESLTAVRPTQPVTPEEQLEPILQSILEELRLTREGKPESDFSLVKLATGIVQVLVLPALFFAFMDRKVPGDLQSMLMLATFLQTLVIALLIMGRSK